MQFEVDRARVYYQNSERLFEYISPEGRRILKAMHQIYGGILNEIEETSEHQRVLKHTKQCRTCKSKGGLDILPVALLFCVFGSLR